MSPRFCRLHSIGPRVALLIFSAVGCLAATAVSNAPSVSPAPIVDKPLTPAANDTPGEQPTPQHAWIPGHWRWSEGAYVWESGHWEIPPAPTVVWHAPEWRQQGSGYVLREGFWDEAPPPSAQTTVAAPAVQSPPPEIVVTAPPPPPQREVIYERPSGTHVWVPGYWAWRGNRHVWVSGHWTTPPRHNLVWVPARWEMRGNRYIFVEGYWRDAVVVTDELCTGTRYFWGQVNTVLPPMEALARHYFSRPPCARFQPSERRFGHIFDMVDEYQVDGVISEIVRYCVSYGHDKPRLKEQMDARDIPILELDLEYGQRGSGQVIIRAEAFLEMLETKHGRPRLVH